MDWRGSCKHSAGGLFCAQGAVRPTCRYRSKKLVRPHSWSIAAPLRGQGCSPEQRETPGWFSNPHSSRESLSLDWACTGTNSNPLDQLWATLLSKLTESRSEEYVVLQWLQTGQRSNENLNTGKTWLYFIYTAPPQLRLPLCAMGHQEAIAGNTYESKTLHQGSSLRSKFWKSSVNVLGHRLHLEPLTHEAWPRLIVFSLTSINYDLNFCPRLGFGLAYFVLHFVLSCFCKTSSFYFFAYIYVPFAIWFFTFSH